jgi:Transglutaminase-like superfamily
MNIERTFRTFYRLSFRRKLLLLSLIPLSLYSTFMLRFFKKKAKFGEKEKKLLDNTLINMTLVKDISFAIRVLSKYTPWENVCRHQAYQAKLLCRFYQIPYQIYVGFKKNNEGKIEGHAWTKVSGEIITGFCKVEEYTIQAVYS